MFDHLKLQNSKNWKKRKLLEAANRTFQIRKYRTCQSFKISIKIGNRQVAQRRRELGQMIRLGDLTWQGITMLQSEGQRRHASESRQ